jgi:CDP-paratose 2-epimerase
MDICCVTGSAGLIGSECVQFFAARGFQLVGIDNDMRRVFFGEEASTAWNRDRLIESVPSYIHHDEDIRDTCKVEKIFREYGREIKLVIHTAAQPSHDWASKDPLTDFSINAMGTLTLLEMTRKYCPDAVFIYTSTNKVYGDNPNTLPLVELEFRYDLDPLHPYYEHGIDESMSIDNCKHSIFGSSKLAADIFVQEYGRYFGMKTACFRAGCLTGPAHSGAQLHGFLVYLMKCNITRAHYSVFGYKGKQVRDNMHSYDLVNMFWHFFQDPKRGEVYNVGGGRHSHCSVLHAIERCCEITGNKMDWSYEPTNRNGDHIWWVSDVRKFKRHYPHWEYTYSLDQILVDIYADLIQRL